MGNGAGNRQAQAATVLVATLARLVATEQGFEQLAHICGVDAGRAVVHGQGDDATIAAPAHGDAAGRVGVAQAIGQQIGQQLFDAAKVPVHGDRLSDLWW